MGPFLTAHFDKVALLTASGISAIAASQADERSRVKKKTLADSFMTGVGVSLAINIVFEGLSHFFANVNNTLFQRVILEKKFNLLFAGLNLVHTYFSPNNGILTSVGYLGFQGSNWVYRKAMEIAFTR